MWLIDPDHLDIIEEIDASPDRAAAIITAAFLEDRLTERIKSRLLKCDEATSFFQPGGVLGNFGAKITLGYLLGLYDKRIKKNLKTIAAVRNAFAHSAAKIGFDSNDPQALCATLQSNLPSLLVVYIRAGEKLPTPPPRQNFLYCSREALMHLIWAGEGPPKRPMLLHLASPDKFSTRSALRGPGKSSSSNKRGRPPRPPRA